MGTQDAPPVNRAANQRAGKRQALCLGIAGRLIIIRSAGRRQCAPSACVQVTAMLPPAPLLAAAQVHKCCQHPRSLSWPTARPTLLADRPAHPPADRPRSCRILICIPSIPRILSSSHGGGGESLYDGPDDVCSRWTSGGGDWVGIHTGAVWIVWRARWVGGGWVGWTDHVLLFRVRSPVPHVSLPCICAMASSFLASVSLQTNGCCWHRSRVTCVIRTCMRGVRESLTWWACCCPVACSSVRVCGCVQLATCLRDSVAHRGFLIDFVSALPPVPAPSNNKATVSFNASLACILNAGRCHILSSVRVLLHFFPETSEGSLRRVSQHMSRRMWTSP